MDHTWFCYIAKIENHWVLQRVVGKGDKNVPVDDTETRTKKKKKRQTGKRREIPELNAIKSTAKEMEVKKKKD